MRIRPNMIFAAESYTSHRLFAPKPWLHNIYRYICQKGNSHLVKLKLEANLRE